MKFLKAKFDLVKPQEKKMDVLETEKAIKETREYFQENLASKLNLSRISAPLIVEDKTGFNDDLNGVERKVNMCLKSGVKASIVQSLAKWKRYALKKYGLKPYTGMYTNMNALRIDEDISNIHSYYVDQWDWELVINEKDRTIEYLKSVVKDIYEVIKSTESFVRSKYTHLSEKLPQDIKFFYTSELEERYPDLSPKEREYEICKENKAVFLMQVGKVLKSGQKHDGRAPDYDDWELNGDILVYNSILDIPFELSSMGVRVSKESMLKQLKECNAMEKCEMVYHRMILNDELPFTLGGGIGQSRLCMFLLEKIHIGEVQVSEWDDKTKQYCEERNITLL
ncbi:Aspartate--ammonia ligase [Nosema granulosis]|uniref:Aspartate--ammonia ligase n=1 Tax=Nosema granulosis TaxID=83296 RepID=A0A9P6H0D7_9MICR|nr:Aspartate--ammonia ligase [Nosema granulosis]